MASVQLSRNSQVGPEGGSAIASSGLTRHRDGGHDATATSGFTRLVVRLQRVAGQREEHVVERGVAHADVLDVDAEVVEPPHRLGHHAPHLVHRDHDAVAAILDVGVAARERRQAFDDAGGVGRMRRHDDDLLAADSPLELGRHAPLDHLTVVDDRDLVGEAVGLLQVLRGEQRRHAARDQLVDQVPHRVAATRIETGRRLVEEQHRRPADEAHGDVEPAPHPARVRAGGAIGGAREVEALQQLAGTGAGVPPGLVEEAPDVLEVLEAGQPLIDRGVLPGEADAGASTPRVGDDVDPVDDGAALVGPEQRGQDAHGGGLARTVGSEHAEDGRPLHAEVDPAQCLRRPEALDQPLGQHRRHRLAAASLLWSRWDLPPSCGLPVSAAGTRTAQPMRPSRGRPPVSPRSRQGRPRRTGIPLA